MALPAIPDTDTLGGLKVDEHAVEDDATDLGADYWNELITDAAAMAQTSFRAWALVGLAATTGAMSIVAHGAQWGADIAVRPTPSRSSDGVFVLTWPATVTDALDVVHNVSFRGFLRPNLDSATLYHAQCASNAANSVTFRVWDAAGSLSNAVGVNALIVML